MADPRLDTSNAAPQEPGDEHTGSRFGRNNVDAAVPHGTRDAARQLEARYNAGQAHRAQQRLHEAVRAFVAALLIDPGHRASLLALGATLCDLARWDDAQRVFGRAVRLFPDDTNAKDGMETVLRRMDEAARADERSRAHVFGSSESDGSGISGYSGAAPTTDDAERPPHADSLRTSGRDIRRTEADPFILVPQLTPRKKLRISGERLQERARLAGLPASFLVIGAHLIVGAHTRQLFLGIAAAVAVALILAITSSLFFPKQHRKLVFRGLLQGIGMGFGLAVAVVLIITLFYSIREGGAAS